MKSKSESEALFDPESLQEYAIADGEANFDNALQNKDGKLPSDGLISIKSSRSEMKPGKEKGSHKSDKKSKDNHDHKSSKRKRT